MPFANAHYYGTEARTIRIFTKREVEKAIIRVVNAIPDSSGPNGIKILKSLGSASNRLQSGKKFVAYVPNEPKSKPCQVLGHDDSKAHSGYCYEWMFLLQMSNGRIGGENTGDDTVSSDDTLIDAVRNGLEAQYSYFRDTLGFYDLKVEQADKMTTNGSALNPLTVTFYNKIRLETDHFLQV